MNGELPIGTPVQWDVRLHDWSPPLTQSGTVAGTYSKDLTIVRCNGGWDLQGADTLVYRPHLRVAEMG